MVVYFSFSVIRRPLHIVTETKDLVNDVKHEVDSVIVSMNNCSYGSTEGIVTAFDYWIPPLDTETELLSFCNKLTNEREFRKQLSGMSKYVLSLSQ